MLRPAGLAKYLPQFGWSPIVLTPKLPAGSVPPVRIIETDYNDVIEDLKAKFQLDPKLGIHEQLGLTYSSKPKSQLFHTRGLDWLKSVIAYPDPQKGWLPFARQALVELGRGESVDAVLSTSTPVCCHILGAEAKEIFRCPWIADCRDLWIGPTSPRVGLLTLLQRRLEMKTLDQADALVTVSKPLAEFLGQRHPTHRVECITNGFDPAEGIACNDRSENVELTKTFSITHTGSLYGGRRDPTALFQAVREMIKEGHLSPLETRLRFYGPAETWLPGLAHSHELDGVVEILGPVTRSESLKRQRESQLLLVIGMRDAADEGCYTGKVFEYLAAERPIIGIEGVGGVLAGLLTETGAGDYAYSKSQLRELLINAYSEYRRLGRVLYRGQHSALRKYTHPEMARSFSGLLNAVVGERSESSHGMCTLDVASV